MAISVYFGALMSCPWDNFARYLYEFEPSINGKRYYESYRQALVAAWYFRKKGQYFVGFHGHFLRHAPYMFGVTELFLNFRVCTLLRIWDCSQDGNTA